MRRIKGQAREALYGFGATRDIEAAATAALPPHTLMARAGQAVAHLARALQPHASCIWIACGPGNNGGDGLMAAVFLQQWACQSGSNCRIWVTHWTGQHADASGLPVDASHALSLAQKAGIAIEPCPPPAWDLAIDALLGIGLTRAPSGVLADWIALLDASRSPTLCVDVPSGLDCDTGWRMPSDGRDQNDLLRPSGLRHTLTFLTLKPGLFTAHGRDACGDIWFDDLQVEAGTQREVTAWLSGLEAPDPTGPQRPHASHKGSFGDVVVIGGQDLMVNGSGMTGAALLAARSALHAGAGRVYVGLLNAPDTEQRVRWDPGAPELMLRRVPSLISNPLLKSATVVCGCGGGDAVVEVLPTVLSASHRLVLDADALNAIAHDDALQKLLRGRASHGQVTVLTPHPLEAARLLACSTADIMHDRLAAARHIANHFECLCVLKGSGSVIGAPGQAPWINPTGNARLATAGTGDVLAGMIGSALSGPDLDSTGWLTQVARAVYHHGLLAEQWNSSVSAAQKEMEPALSASRLAERVPPLC